MEKPSKFGNDEFAVPICPVCEEKWPAVSLYKCRYDKRPSYTHIEVDLTSTMPEPMRSEFNSRFQWRAVCRFKDPARSVMLMEVVTAALWKAHDENQFRFLGRLNKAVTWILEDEAEMPNILRLLKDMEYGHLVKVLGG